MCVGIYVADYSLESFSTAAKYCIITYLRSHLGTLTLLQRTLEHFSTQEEATQVPERDLECTTVGLGNT